MLLTFIFLYKILHIIKHFLYLQCSIINVFTLLMKPKYFTLRELCESHTANQNYICNIPTWNIVFNLQRLAFRLDDIRQIYGKPITVTSGYRCNAVNNLVGGATNSFHIHGLAADITSDELNTLYDIVQQFKWSECYVNKSKNYIHVAL